MPRLSVIIPTYNRAALLQEAIASVQAQTFTDFEIIVVDDGSTDGTQALLERLNVEGVLRYAVQENAGPAAARNRAIAMSEGKYVTFLDDDDLYVPNKLEREVAYLEAHPDMGLVHSDFIKFDAKHPDLGYRDTSFFSGHVYPGLLTYWKQFIATPTVMLPRRVLDEVGDFDERLRWGEDPDMWRRIARRYPLGHIPEALAKIRVVAASNSADKTRAAQAFENYLQIAIEDDPELASSLRRRAYAGMYTNTALNLLGEGQREDMPLVRQYSIKALAHWPLAVKALVAWKVSLVPLAVRARLAALWRGLRYARQSN
ncbi:MAG: glycosyltransferase family 2 protein [Chloroflexi bacterium]|nr:MAG: glycosyltransferase family 2 protein [Chloroflexota bacterium]MBL1193178.1 glycosyltransferase family 2 protein [Chloroflexota bacterium]NOH10471.1 glycosyltransferase family 2 protein [Chloroflexota bacterium]